MPKAAFDTWTDKYDSWFDTPVGRLVKQFEADVLMEMLDPQPGDRILDVGCGTGIFTRGVLERGADVTGVDLSFPMLEKANEKESDSSFNAGLADMCALPFPDNHFHRVFSMTAIEFVADAAGAVSELERVTQPGGCIVVTTLNSLSPWADRRKQKADKGHSLFQNIYFRSPDDMRSLAGENAVVKTAIHFAKDAPVADIPAIEKRGSVDTPDTGAFLAVQWEK
ncbi:MAG: methyltransferase domain-containing protein [Desulfobacterales bacterium]|nr:methyltransferase domain-containing protein [Desulfobacterales bacterium]